MVSLGFCVFICGINSRSKARRPLPLTVIPTGNPTANASVRSLVVWPPECVTIGRTKPICPPRVGLFCACACVCACACSCACASGTLPAKVVASTKNTIHALLLRLLISFDAPVVRNFLRVVQRVGTIRFMPLVKRTKYGRVISVRHGVAAGAPHWRRLGKKRFAYANS